MTGTIPERGSSTGGDPDGSPRRVVEVALADARSYPVIVGPGTIEELSGLIPGSALRVALVTQDGVPVEVDPGVAVERCVIGDGEAHKRMATVEALCARWARAGLTRADCVVAVGGGIVTDVAGFAASVYHRGLPVIHVATTLLAQIDAAIGGKTGVNLPEGKNLVGSYWQPRAVICDTGALESLPEREWRCGLGEMAKYHWLGGGALDGLELTDRIAACVSIKARIVAQDERESGRRALLNYGHTLAHALETAGGHELRHGEAVGIGLVFAAGLARALGRIDDGEVAEHRRVVEGYGLATQLPPGVEPSTLVDLMARDKKSLGSGLTFVLAGAPEPVDGIDLEVVTGIDRQLVTETLQTML